MYKYLFLLLLLVGCRTHKEAAKITYTQKDSTKVEIVATERVVELAIKEQNRTERTESTNQKRSSVVDAKTTTKQAIVVARNETKQTKQKTKEVVSVAKIEAKTKQTEVKAVAKTEQKQIESVIVAKKQFPNSVKWIAVLLAVAIFGWLVIKKKIPFLS